MNRTRFFWMLAALLGILAIAAIAVGFQALRSLGTTSVVVEWTTASELDTAGFFLYRSDTPDGPFEKVNQNIIPASPDPITGGEYSYTDQGVKPGQTYYYELEDVELSGNTSRHGPIAVQATSGGWLQLILAGFLLLTAGFGAWMLVAQNRKPSPEVTNEA